MTKAEEFNQIARNYNNFLVELKRIKESINLAASKGDFACNFSVNENIVDKIIIVLFDDGFTVVKQLRGCVLVRWDGPSVRWNEGARMKATATKHNRDKKNNEEINNILEICKKEAEIGNFNVRVSSIRDSVSNRLWNMGFKYSSDDNGDIYISWG